MHGGLENMKVKKKVFVYYPHWNQYYPTTLVCIFSSPKEEVKKWVYDHCDELGLSQDYDYDQLYFWETVVEEDNNE